MYSQSRVQDGLVGGRISIAWLEGLVLRGTSGVQVLFHKQRVCDTTGTNTPSGKVVTAIVAMCSPDLALCDHPYHSMDTFDSSRSVKSRVSTHIVSME